MRIFKLIFNVLEEQSILKTTKTKPIVDAIKNRQKISFMYNGPRKSKKDFEGKKVDSVKPGKRVKVEPVAIGLSKKGSLIMRAFVQPPSVSKKGFGKTGWRTFMLSRMSNVDITNDVFNEKRPGYKEGPDGSMTTTYVTTDWTKTPQIKKQEKPTKKVEPVKTVKKVEPVKEPEKEPVVKPTKEPLPQPKIDKKPEKIIEPKPEKVTEPKPEEKPIKEPEVKLGKEIKPKKEPLPEPKPEEKPKKDVETSDDNDMEPLIGLSEEIKRIKTLMFD